MLVVECSSVGNLFINPFVLAMTNIIKAVALVEMRDRASLQLDQGVLHQSTHK